MSDEVIFIEDELKREACAFATWLWENVNEDEMASNTWEDLYDTYQESLESDPDNDPPEVG